MKICMLIIRGFTMLIIQKQEKKRVFPMHGAFLNWEALFLFKIFFLFSVTLWVPLSSSHDNWHFCLKNQNMHGNRLTLLIYNLHVTSLKLFFLYLVMEICLLITYFGESVRNHLIMLLHVWLPFH